MAINSTALGESSSERSDGTLPSVGSLPQAVLSGNYCGRYRIEEQLGSGSMGAVYKACDPLLNRVVALKSILTGLNELTGGLRFLREAEVLARLEHPNIVRIFDAGVYEQTSFIVLEYLSGEPLRTLLDKRKRLGVAEAMSLLFPVISAIDYAHCQGVLHLDLKPSNLLITHDHLDRACATVLDFGVCQLSDVAGELDPTRDEHAGTPAYMSPEALQRKELTPAADQFSLATLLYECLTGIAPFSLGSRHDMVSAKLAGSFPALSSLCPDATPQLAEVVTRALSPEPDKRFASVRAFGAALLPGSPEAVALRYDADFRRARAAD